MADQNPTDRRSDSPPRPEHRDARVQRALLAFVLFEHPIQLSAAEVERELCRGQDAAAEDAVERAINDLVAVGLLRRSGELVVPTRAAIHLDRLERD